MQASLGCIQGLFLRRASFNAWIHFFHDKKMGICILRIFCDKLIKVSDAGENGFNLDLWTAKFEA